MFRAKLGYNQPANAYASLGIMAAGSGDTASSTSPAARRRSTFPRTARSAWSASRSVPTRRCPTARRISTRFSHRGHQLRQRRQRAAEDAEPAAGDRETHARADARRAHRQKRGAAAQDFIRRSPRGQRLLAAGEEEFFNVIDKVPMAYQKANAIFATPRRRARAPAASSRSSSRISARMRGASPPAASTRRCGWCRRPRKSTPSTKAAPRSSTCCRTRRRSISALQRHAAAGSRRRRCATC